jgi:hypothetical protein
MASHELNALIWHINAKIREDLGDLADTIDARWTSHLVCTVGTWREFIKLAQLGATVENMPIKSSLEHWDDNEWIYDECHPIDQQTSKDRRGLEKTPLEAIEKAKWIN